MDQSTPESSVAFGALFGNRVYALRVVQLLAVWFLAYVTVFGFLACALFAVAFADRLERKLWILIGAAITVIGGVIVAEAGTSSLAIAFVGAAIVFFGFNIWVPMTYTLSTESFPTRAPGRYYEEISP